MKQIHDLRTKVQDTHRLNLFEDIGLGDPVSPPLMWAQGRIPFQFTSTSITLALRRRKSTIQLQASRRGKEQIMAQGILITWVRLKLRMVGTTGDKAESLLW